MVLSSEGRELERRPVRFDAHGRAEARFDVQQARPGLYRYDARVEPAPGEVILVNNAESFLLRVVDEPIRVLLLEGKPYWDAKFLMRTLGSDPSIELDSVVRLAEGRFLRRTLGRPSGRSPGREASHASSGAVPQADQSVSRVDDWKILTSPDEILAGQDGLGAIRSSSSGATPTCSWARSGRSAARRGSPRTAVRLVCYRGAPAAQLSQPLARLLPVRWSRSPRVAVPRATDRARSRAALAALRRMPGRPATRWPGCRRSPATSSRKSRSRWRSCWRPRPPASGRCRGGRCRSSPISLMARAASW